MMQAVAIILARAGSKGVPGKNIVPVAGRPCIAWTIEHAQRSARVGLVAVSSDDPRALDVARSMGARAVERPAALAHDTARVDDASRHAADVLGIPPADPRPIVMLYANVPVRPGHLTDAAVDLLGRTRADSVQSYVRVGKFHPWWTARLGEGGRVVVALTARALFEQTGAPPGPHAFFGLERRGIESASVALPGEYASVIDIDEPTDLLVASAVLGARGAGRVQPVGAPST
jgi:CMP-N,N'-diacetyllegionaminic acid synthase